jgi:hypothetical protein
VFLGREPVLSPLFTLLGTFCTPRRKFITDKGDVGGSRINPPAQKHCGFITRTVVYEFQIGKAGVPVSASLNIRLSSSAENK